MLKKKLPLLVIGIFVLIIIGGMLTSYNSLVAKSEAVENAWNNLEAQYNKRIDLISNLFEAMERDSFQEGKILNDVRNAKNQATKTNFKTNLSNAEKVKQLQKTQSELAQAISDLFTFEKFDDIAQTNEDIKEIGTQLEAIKETIHESVQQYNLSAKGYNGYMNRYPIRIVSSLFGFKEVAVLDLPE